MTWIGIMVFSVLACPLLVVVGTAALVVDAAKEVAERVLKKRP